MPEILKPGQKRLTLVIDEPLRLALLDEVTRRKRDQLENASDRGVVIEALTKFLPKAKKP